MSPQTRHVSGYWRRHSAATLRWLHIYLSMASFMALLFFAVTGITLNHASWFDSIPPQTRTTQNHIPTTWLQTETPKELQIVEHLRSTHHIHGALSEFFTDDEQCRLSFRGPGYIADASIDRTTGEYELAETRMGLVAILNDLHKGRDTGPAWSLVIDASAILMIVVSLTGLTLLYFLKRRRITGTLVTIAGSIAFLLLYYLLVP
ncbi:MAG: hypothetical protein RI897_4424 [Verrucomicrobiota bacterium]|jgi:hypothetical protein